MIHKKFRAARHIRYNSNILKLMVSEKAPRLPHTGSVVTCMAGCPGEGSSHSINSFYMINEGLSESICLQSASHQGTPKQGIHPQSEQEEPGRPLALDSPTHDQVHTA